MSLNSAPPFTLSLDFSRFFLKFKPANISYIYFLQIEDGPFIFFLFFNNQIRCHHNGVVLGGMERDKTRKTWICTLFQRFSVNYAQGSTVIKKPPKTMWSYHGQNCVCFNTLRNINTVMQLEECPLYSNLLESLFILKWLYLLNLYMI